MRLDDLMCGIEEGRVEILPEHRDIYSPKLGGSD